MKIPYRDLSVKDLRRKRELLAAVEKVLSHGRMILGPEVGRFEQLMADSCSKQYAVGVSSGTDALYLALRSLGVGPGDEVITTPLSWIATTNAIVQCGAEAVFVDIGEDLNIDADLISEAVTPRTRAILPVHFTGRLCAMDTILHIAGERNLLVIEDAAQAFGARRGEKQAGSFGHAGCFSMNPMKIWCACGEAGAVVTDDRDVYEKLCTLRYAGTVNKEDCHYPSLNGRIDTVQAAMLLVDFNYLPEKIARRQEIARVYTEGLHDLVGCPREDGSYHCYYSYTVLAEKREKLVEHLSGKGIETKVQHPILMPYHTAYKDRTYPPLPVAERLVNRILCLPNQEDLSTEEIDYVIGSVREFYEGQAP